MKLNLKRGPKKRFRLQRPQASEIKAAFSSKSFKVGGYSVAAAVVVIAIAVAVNMIAGALPAGVTQLDMTTSGVYSLSQETENLLSGLEEEVTVYWVVQDGQEDVTLEHLLDRYEAGSSKIKVVKRDPDVYPTFLAQYDVSETYNNSLIVESGETFRYVSYNDVYEYDYSSYSYDYSYTTSFAGENALTSAINYVISSDLPKIYILTGHGESELSTTFAGAVQSANIEYEELSLLTEEAVPEDADAIMICSPQSDISAEEEELLADYLAAGGNLMLLTLKPCAMDRRT